MSILYMRVKPVKRFECSCANGFTGDFCEFKAEQNRLLYLVFNVGYVLTDDVQFIQKSLTFDGNVGAYDSCFTMLNGETVISGGVLSLERLLSRQVTISNSL